MERNMNSRSEKSTNFGEKIAIGAIAICFATIAAVCLFLPSGQKGEIHSQETHNSPENSQNIAKSHTAKADEKDESSTVTKYILKYDGKNVILSIISPGGSETEHKIEKINARYLTDYDINLLKEGIELSDDDELYKILEDFSS